MFKALNVQNNAEVVIIDPKWQRDIENLRSMDRQNNLVCQGCREPVRFRAGEERRHHFAHKLFARRQVVIGKCRNIMSISEKPSYMTSSDIEALFKRLGRLVHASQKKEGDGTAWDFSFPDGETHHYIIRNIRSHLDIDDSVSNLLIWVWNSKDYLKNRLRNKGVDPEYVEQFINGNHQLAVCGDLANLLKHGNHKKGRSGKLPRLGAVGYTIPQTAVPTLSFRAFGVDIDVGNPDGVEFRIPILDSKGLEFGEAFEYITAAINGLETLWKDIENV